MSRKKCFVIAPIGEQGSSTRIRSDQILSYVIRPVAQNYGFDVSRADEIDEPGIISNQVLNRILEDPLVIADLTERNPNVYYELAVRHAAGKPVIQLLQKNEPLPFDVAAIRTIVVDHKDLDSVEKAKRTLAQYIENIESGTYDRVDSPISLALDLQKLRESNDPSRSSLADLVERMTGVHGAVLSIQEFIDTGLPRQLDQLLRLVITLKSATSNNDSIGAVSELSDSVEELRQRLIAAVSTILDEIQVQHAELAVKIQSVFDEQSETATESVTADFGRVVADVVPDDADQLSLMERILETFMHGMKSMGTFQRINVTNQTEASTNAIRDRINKSIEDVFRGIENIEDKVTALPLQAPGKLT